MQQIQDLCVNLQLCNLQCESYGLADYEPEKQSGGFFEHCALQVISVWHVGRANLHFTTRACKCTELPALVLKLCNGNGAFILS